MCKASCLRILNGRHKSGRDDDFTFAGSKGMSVIDYFISTPDIFHIVDQIIVSFFTVYSDHAPLHVKLMIRSGQVFSKDDTASCKAASQEFSCYIWNQERCNDAMEAL